MAAPEEKKGKTCGGAGATHGSPDTSPARQHTACAASFQRGLRQSASTPPSLLQLDVGSLGRDQALVNVRDHTATSNGSADKGIQLLVTTNSQLQMAGSDTLHLQILGGVASQLKHLGSQVLQDSAGVHSSGGTHTLVVAHTLLQETVNTTYRELQTSTSRSGLGGLLATYLALATYTLAANALATLAADCERSKSR